MRRSRGFTLVEIVVVLLIFGIILAMAAAITRGVVASQKRSVTATRMATQVFGGYGFMDETLVARQYRDAKILEIGEGTSEIQRLVIARGLGLPIS